MGEPNKLPVHKRETRLYTEVQAKVLRVLLDIRLFGGPRSKLIAASGVSPKTFYRTIQDEWFVQQYHSVVQRAFGLEFARVMHAHLETAAIAGREGVADRRMYFQMLGLLDERGKTDETHTHHHYYPAQLRAAFLRTQEALVPPTIPKEMRDEVFEPRTIEEIPTDPSDPPGPERLLPG